MQDIGRKTSVKTVVEEGRLYEYAKDTSGRIHKKPVNIAIFSIKEKEQGHD